MIAAGRHPLQPVIRIRNEELHLFSKHFAFRPHSLVNFVGGGGKTRLILKLMEEYCAAGPVLYTTTTRIHPPDPRENLFVVSCENLPLLKRIVDTIGRSWESLPTKLVAASCFISPTLLRGLPPDFSNELDRNFFPILLNEADGAASFSIKMPGEHEPVLMEQAEYLVPVIGLDCLGKPLSADVFFRWKSFAMHSSLREGECITPDFAANILMHARGVCRHWNPGMHIIPFINKVDDSSQDAAARELARFILQNGRYPVERVVYGSLSQKRVYSVSAPAK